MWQHNFKLAIRTFRKDKSTFLINLIGLATGLACTLLIYLWIADELKVDSFHEQEDRLYQVLINYSEPDGISTESSTQGLLATSLAYEFPEIAKSAAVIPVDWFANKGIIGTENQQFKADGQFVGKDYFDIFSWKILEGDRANLLVDKNKVLLSDDLAKRLFPSHKNIIGETIQWEQGKFSGAYQVAGIFEKPSKYSSLQFDVVFNYELFYEKYKNNLDQWSNSNPDTYLLLKEDVDIAAFGEKIKYFSQDKLKAAGWDIASAKVAGELVLQPFAKRYLYNHFENGVQAGGRIDYVLIFGWIALFILAIASVNFINLSTARASLRAKEIGVKKAIGAEKKTLLYQHLSEAVLLTFCALIIALALVHLSLPSFNAITEKALSLSLNFNLIIAISAITLGTGLLAGSYPAFYLSALQPIDVLKGKVSTSIKEVWLRKGLVVFQFMISILLIVGAIIVYEQIQFIQTKNLGINKDNVISFKREGKLKDNLPTFVTEIKKIPGVVKVSSLANNFTTEYGSTSGIKWEGKAKETRIQFGALAVDYGLIELMDIEMKEGRAFSKSYGAEDSKIIFNEAAIKAMGLVNPIGKTVELWGQPVEIIGVTRNFHFESFYEAIKPTFFHFMPNRRNVFVKIEKGKEKATIAQINQFYTDFTEGLPFEYHFLDADFEALYASEERVAILVRYFSGIAILISCLGLFGLITFSAQHRMKEIGIRKVLGASTVEIVRLLSTDFTKMVIIAIMLALPLSYHLAKNWLADFAFSIQLQPLFFIIAGIGSLLFAWVTVIPQTLKAANQNPIESLKEE